MESERKNLVVFILILLVSIGALIFLFEKFGFIRKSGKVYYAIFEDVKGITEKSDVRIAGIKVGYVEDLSVLIKDGKAYAKVKMIVDRKFPIMEGFAARIRAKSLLGEKYIELFPEEKSEKFAEEGFTITKTYELVDIDEFIFSLKPFIDSINPEVLKELSSFVPRFVKIVDPLVENTNKTLESINRLTPSLLGILDNLDKMTKSLQSTVKVLEENSERVEVILKVLPQTLNITNNTLQKFSFFLDETTRIVDRESLQLAIKYMPEILTNTSFILESVVKFVPEFSRVLTETSLTLQELRRALQEGIKARVRLF